MAPDVIGLLQLLAGALIAIFYAVWRWRARFIRENNRRFSLLFNKLHNEACAAFGPLLADSLRVLLSRRNAAQNLDSDQLQRTAASMIRQADPIEVRRAADEIMNAGRPREMYSSVIQTYDMALYSILLTIVAILMWAPKATGVSLNGIEEVLLIAAAFVFAVPLIVFITNLPERIGYWRTLKILLIENGLLLIEDEDEEVILPRPAE